MFDAELFERGADVRGEYPRQINEELAWFVGRYLVQYLESRGHSLPGVVVGRDGRHSSPSLYRALVRGIAAAGGKPVPAGLATTDMVLWAAGEGLGGAVAGAMVTASHNPPQYNGIKAVVRGEAGVETIRPVSHLRPLYKADKESDRPVTASEISGAPFPESARLDLPTRFVEAACRRAPDRAQFGGTIVLDPGNGVGSLFIDPLKKQLPGVRIESIFDEIDGSFPNRPSNPGLPGATRALEEKVRQLGAQFGAAFDGDADRVFLVDENGRFVPGDHVLAALARVMLTREAAKRGTSDGLGPVIFASTCSWLLPQTIRRYGGEPVICKVGQESIKGAMAALKAVFAGEASAHFNFPDSYLQDSGLIALMTFWQWLHSEGLTVSQAVKQLGPWPQSGEINIRIHSDDWAEISAKTIEELRDQYGKKKNECYVLDIDGICVYYPYRPDIPDVEALFPRKPGELAEMPFRGVHPDYTPERWFSLRRSNNEPLLRLNVECRDPEKLEAEARSRLAEVRAMCEKIGGCSTEVEDWGYLKPEQ